jgi:hypothetical protein
MHLRDACRSEAARFPEADTAHAYFELAASALQHLRENAAV